MGSKGVWGRCPQPGVPPLHPVLTNMAVVILQQLSPGYHSTNLPSASSVPPSAAKTVEQVLNLLARLLDDLPLATSLAALKTCEETAASFYHAALSRLLPDPFRNQNVGINPIGRLTNLGVALLSQRLQTTLQTVGLDLESSNPHLDATTRPPLLCDFLTALQVSIVDTLVMHLLTTHQIVPDDFIWFEQGLFLQPSALELFIQQWDEKLSATVHHLYAGPVTYHQCLDIQAQEYLACLLEEETFYRPMLLKR